MSLPKKLLQKQQSQIRDRLKRQQIILESFAAFLGFRAYWLDKNKLIWRRVDSAKTPYETTRQALKRAYKQAAVDMEALKRQRDIEHHAEPPIRPRQISSRRLRGVRPRKD